MIVRGSGTFSGRFPLTIIDKGRPVAHIVRQGFRDVIGRWHPRG
jgi:hypothetical protein